MCRSEGLPSTGGSPARTRRSPLRAGLLVLMMALTATAAMVPVAPGASAAPSSRLSWSMTVNGRDVSSADANTPLRLSPRTPADVVVKVANLGSAPVGVRSVRLEGRVLGLAFYSYTTRVDMQVAPGASDERRFAIDLLGLDGQATGLIPSQAVLLDTNGHRIDSHSLAVDVRGSLRSVYGTFGLAVAAITLLLLISALWRLLTGRLNHNRWRRAMTFAAPGLGAGFTLTFTLSALRLMVPAAGMWALLILVGGAIGFILGYLTPTPERAGRDAEQDEPPRQQFGRPSMVDLREPNAPVHRADRPTRSDSQ
jgi:hypothetical protein